MQTPIPTEEKKKKGCSYYVIILVTGIAGLFVLDYMLALIFHRAYPADELTSAFIPFQNHYLAFTDAYLTNEGMTSEFTNDLGATGRFLGSSVLVVVGLIIITVVLFLIPATRKWVDSIMVTLYLPILILTMIHALFFPGTRTVFNRDKKVMTVAQYRWWFFPKTQTIPFADILSFSYEQEDVKSYAASEHGEFAAIYAHTGQQKIFIGENQTGAHASTDVSWKITTQKEKEVLDALSSLHQLVGLTPKNVP